MEVAYLAYLAAAWVTWRGSGCGNDDLHKVTLKCWSPNGQNVGELGIAKYGRT
jgi:hypothetical protein